MTPRARAIRPTLLIAGTAVPLLLAACGRAEPAAGDVRPGAAGSDDAVEVVAVDDVFRPTVLEAEAGEEVTVVVRNGGDRAHNLVIEDLDLSTGTVEPGEVVTATFTAPDSAVEFVCTFHRDMVGELRVAPAGS